ncbi:murein biosynthesis integral membrane protein MurJ [Kordiimonas pumila]|uniref:Probable lipid II flippase MurJ n=1 Tax=Kordiimonas pumila TaxID=2161677 RepID=A0ABV7D9X6_9PROT|nr:murein biosynthesis integral membrane protein MurJ [Kordiimonas pumila]
MSLLKGISTVGGYTLLSRVFGVIRDLLMARYLGAGMAADAFFIAFKLPNFFRRLFAEGAFSVGFVPLFARALGKDITPESKAAAEAFAGRVLAWQLPVLLVFLVIMEIAMAPFMLGLTGGFEGDATKFNFVVELGRYTFPYLALISLVSFYAGMLNAFGRYSAAAFAPVILNVCMISSLLLYGETEEGGARALSIAVSAAGVAQLIWLYGVARKLGVSLKLPRPTLSPDVKELLRIIGPAAIGAGVTQINLLIDVLIAARFLPEGSVSWLFYADRLSQLPLGVIGIAVGTVLLPSISRLLSVNDHKGANGQQNRAIEFSLFLTLPSAIALAIMAGPILATLFERDAFTAHDTNATAAALMVYAAGLPAYVIAKALTPGYFARKDTRTPVRFAIVSLIINTTLNFILIQYFAHVGLAAATAIAAWVNAGLLYGGLRKRNHLTLEKITLIRLAKCIISSAVMGIAVYFITRESASVFLTDGLTRVASLAGIIVVGILVYVLVNIVLRTLTTAELKRFVRPNA